MYDSKTQAQIIATDHAANLGRDLIARIKRIAKRAGFVSGIGLSVSMPHQMAFIISLVHLRWGSVQEALLSATVVGAAVGIPVMLDLLILNCIDTIATRGMDAAARAYALKLIWYPIGLSGAVNVLAPAPWQLRVLLAAMVSLIPAAETLRSKARADFQEIHEIETQAGTVIVEPEPVEDDVPDTSERAVRMRETRERVAALTPYQKRKYEGLTPYKRRQYLVQVAEKQLGDAVDAAIAEAVPVSPAPAGR